MDVARLRRLVRPLACALPAMAFLCGSAAFAADAWTPKVVATIKPVHSLVAAVMAGAGSPKLLIAGAASPHTYALRPTEVRTLNAAQLVVRVSPDLEVFLSGAIATLPKGIEVLTLETQPGMVRHPLRSGGAFEAHADDHGPDVHGHRGAHGTRAASAGSGHFDPHVWLDPVNARVIARSVAEALARLAPEHAALYRANAAALDTRLVDLERRVHSNLLAVKGLRYLVFHDAYQYFERRFGLTVVGSVTTSPDIPPSALRLRDLRERLARTGAVCVFAEPQFPPRIVATVVESTRVRRGTLDPLGAAVPEGPDHYVTVIEGLARDLKSCLADQA